MASLVINISTTAGQDSGLQYVWDTWWGPAPQNPGSGYVVGDILSLAGGTGTPATFKVTGVDSAGAVTNVAVATSGVYTALPASPNQVTGGTGTGCKLKTPYATIADMLADFCMETVKDFRNQWKNAQRSVVSGAVETASGSQLANAATALGVTLP